MSKQKKTNILAAVMLKEVFDKEVVCVHVKIGKYTVMLTTDQFANIYLPKIDKKGAVK